MIEIETYGEAWLILYCWLREKREDRDTKVSVQEPPTTKKWSPFKPLW